MRQASRSRQAATQKLIVIGQVHEYTPRPSYHPLDLFKRWVDKQVNRVFRKAIEKGFKPRTPNGEVYLP